MPGSREALAARAGRRSGRARAAPFSRGRVAPVSRAGARHHSAAR